MCLVIFHNRLVVFLLQICTILLFDIYHRSHRSILYHLLLKHIGNSFRSHITIGWLCFCQRVFLIMEKSTHMKISVFVKRILQIPITIFWCYRYFHRVLTARSPGNNLLSFPICNPEIAACKFFGIGYRYLVNLIGCLLIGFYTLCINNRSLFILISQFYRYLCLIQIITV